MKTCNTCQQSKPATEFNKDRAKKDGLCFKCKDCQKTYREANKEKFKAYSKVYYEEYRDKIKAYSKTYREANKEKIKAKVKAYREANKEKFKALNKAYKQTNPGKVNALNMKRYAQKLQATPPWLTKKHLSEIQKWYKLAKDLQHLSEEPLEVDHIVPLQGKNVCGLHVPWNLQILPKSENISKGNKFPLRKPKI
jgi:5-methylcytosine-specific restriction endonuclease McrA